MPAIRRYAVTQTRKIHVIVDSKSEGQSYEQVALEKATKALENPGQPQQGMSLGVDGMPEIVTTTIHRESTQAVGE